MALITLPASIEWDQFPDFVPLPTVQVNRSQWSNGRRVLDLDNGFYVARATAFANTESAVRELRAFHAKLRGAANTFKMPASRCQQVASNLTAAGGEAAGATLIDVSGAAGLVLPAGIFATIVYGTDDEQLVMLTAQTTLSGGGAGGLQIDMPLRKALANAKSIVVTEPRAIVALAPSSPPPRDQDGAVIWEMEVEEAF